MGKKDKTIDIERIKKAVGEILLAVGEDVQREGLKRTPERVARRVNQLVRETVGIERRKVFVQKAS